MPTIKQETPLTGKTKDGELLTQQEELFCNEYIFSKGNGTEAAMKAYDCKTRNQAGVYANRMLRNDKILKRINELVDKHIMTDEEADFELQKVARQDSELSAKVKAITERNKMKGRYEKDNEQKRQQVVIEAINYVKPNGANPKT